MQRLLELGDRRLALLLDHGVVQMDLRGPDAAFPANLLRIVGAVDKRVIPERTAPNSNW